MRKTKNVFFLLILILSIWIVLLNNGGEKASGNELAMASSIYFACAIPILIYFGSSERNIPYVPMYAIVYFLYFALSIFTKYDLIRMSFTNQELIGKTLATILMGILSFILAFYGYPGKTIESIFPHLNVTLDPKKSYRLGFQIFIFTFFMTLFTQKHRILILSSGVDNFISSLPLLAIVILYLLFLQGKLKFNGKILLWGVFIPLRFLIVISGGGFGPLVYETMALFFIYFYYRQRIPWLFVILISVPYLFIWGARDEYRRITWAGDNEYAAQGQFQKAFLYLRLSYEGVLHKKEFASDAYDRLAARSNHLATFIKVVELTPDYIPYWGGHTYYTLFTSLIPRFIYPEKPSKILGQEFGHRYMLLSPDDMYTSYNLPMLVELYVNWGQVGICFGMFVFGIILRIVYSLVNHPQCGDGGLVIGVMIAASLMNLEADFSLAFGNLLQYILLFYIIMKRMKVSIKRVEVIS